MAFNILIHQPLLAKRYYGTLAFYIIIVTNVPIFIYLHMPLSEQLLLVILILVVKVHLMCV